MIDLKRRSPLGVILSTLAMTPLAVVRRLHPVMHDGFISGLRAYSDSAFVALGKAADPQMRTEFLPSPSRFGPTPTIVVFCRPDVAVP